MSRQSLTRIWPLTLIILVKRVMIWLNDLIDSTSFNIQRQVSLRNYLLARVWSQTSSILISSRKKSYDLTLLPESSNFQILKWPLTSTILANSRRVTLWIDTTTALSQPVSKFSFQILLPVESGQNLTMNLSILVSSLDSWSDLMVNQKMLSLKFLCWIIHC